MKLPKHLVIPVLCLVVFLIALILWLIWGNFTLTVTRITIRDRDIPDGFSGYRIAQISDLHSASFGPDNKRLLDALSAEKPDLIVLTGDLVSRTDTDFSTALSFARAASAIAQTCYVPGNHEGSLNESVSYEQLQEGLREAGVTLLDNQSIVLSREGSSVSLIGIQDPRFALAYPFMEVITSEEIELKTETYISDTLRTLTERADCYQILLSHRPEYLPIYAEFDVDLVFSGHAHGGQIRLPFLGGIWAPGQGFFPAYDSGLYTVGETNLVVSRGLGSSSFPVRVNNRPEIILVTLETA